ncbi:SpoIIIAH-like family protein [Paenibacillus mendelii]|uniref:SpoIIIAH-like family protein n=1 Tax=Paenibacillus mendelii TaxID=206163 RepID=A0ABV6JH87_9BACL|nr:SpoIIIAH-like family protein [Paenibacillus mendelii]MCQ6558156.1 SpoIIIAH-like family protein [Paenibacillus mendelii]
MNTKRQTVWLVSMLSLMVILSAYYLFTEDVDTSSDMLTDGTQQEQTILPNATEAAAGDSSKENGIVVDKVVSPDGQAAPETALTDTGEEAKANQISEEDQEVLRKIEAEGAAGSIFDEIQYKRDQKFYEENNRLYSVISDTKQNPEQATKAIDQLDQLEEKNAKITGLEEELGKQFNIAIVSPEPNDKYKVVVQSEKLEKSQADSIVMLAMKELGLSANQVSVQYIP